MTTLREPTVARAPRRGPARGAGAGPIARPRLVVLTTTFPRWVGDREPPFVYELSRRLADAFDVTVLAPAAPGAQDCERMDTLVVRRYRYCIGPWQVLAYGGGILANLRRRRATWLLVPLLCLAQLLALWRELRRSPVAAVHAHWLLPQGLIALLACACLPGPRPAIVCTSHGGDLFALRGRISTWLKAIVLRRATAATVVSRAMREHAQDLSGRADIAVVSMGIDAAKTFVPSPATARDAAGLLFVGRLVEKKGLHVLLEALPAVARRHPDVTLTVAGSGPEQDALRQRAQALGMADRIRWLGAVANADLPELYCRATAFVGPSVVDGRGDQEGLGLVFAEAQACGCPVVASDLAAIRDVVQDGVTGLVAPAGDAPELARRIDLLLGDPDLRTRLAGAARERVAREFDWGGVAARYRALISAAAAPAAGVRGGRPA